MKTKFKNWTQVSLHEVNGSKNSLKLILRLGNVFWTRITFFTISRQITYELFEQLCIFLRTLVKNNCFYFSVKFKLNYKSEVLSFYQCRVRWRWRKLFGNLANILLDKSQIESHYEFLAESKSWKKFNFLSNLNGFLL